MFYARFQGGTLDDLFTTGNGVYQTSVSLAATQAPQLAAGPVFPNALTSIPTGGSVSAASIQMLAPNLKTPYSEQGNIGIQRQLASDISINVSYIWSRGVQLYGVRDLNLPTATTNFTYTIDNASGSPVGTYTTPVITGKRPDTRYGTIAYAENGVNSYYNGLAVQVNKRFTHGLQALVSYTWSHEIDDGQSYGESTNNLWLSGASYWLNNGNYKADKGSGTLDQRHRVALSWVWAPTFTHRTDAFSKYVVNGWQLSSITTMQTGWPYGSYDCLPERHTGHRHVLQLQPEWIGPQFPRAVGAGERLPLPLDVPLRRASQQDHSDHRARPALSQLRGVQPREHVGRHRLYQQPCLFRDQRRDHGDAAAPVYPVGRRRAPRRHGGAPHADQRPHCLLGFRTRCSTFGGRGGGGAGKAENVFPRYSDEVGSS